MSALLQGSSEKIWIPEAIDNTFWSMLQLKTIRKKSDAVDLRSHMDFTSHQSEYMRFSENNGTNKFSHFYKIIHKRFISHIK